jgi:hypothetical protein
LKASSAYQKFFYNLTPTADVCTTALAAEGATDSRTFNFPTNRSLKDENNAQDNLYSPFNLFALFPEPHRIPRAGDRDAASRREHYFDDDSAGLIEP